MESSTSVIDVCWTLDQSETMALIGQFQSNDQNLSREGIRWSVSEKHLAWLIEHTIMISNSQFRPNE